jgi:hypothetical protein
MTMHTPDPWRVKGSTVVDGRTYLIVSAGAVGAEDERQVALVGAWEIQGERNAQLVAAAPKMFAACQAVAECWEGSDLADAVRRCRAAMIDAIPSHAPPKQQPASVREIHLPCYGMTIWLDRKHAPDRPGCGTITSDLKEIEQGIEGARFNAAIDGLESLILALACAGIDVQSPACIEAIEMAVEAIANHL